jgi:pimeloyl-ACP methyl ester carboxylesterase
LPTLIYLPGLQGDWTLITGLRQAVAGSVHFVEMTYPRTLTWSITDYAAAIKEALRHRGITGGWLLAESFGSQIAWSLLEQNSSVPTGRPRTPLAFSGLVLAGGFIKHPIKHGPRILRRIGMLIPTPLYGLAVKLFISGLKYRRRNSPEVLAGFREFAGRRTYLDRQAMRHRLTLLAQNDPRPTARATRVPVYQLAGLFDPLVPAFPVRRWLVKHCPGYRGGKTFWRASHGVLVDCPSESAGMILGWMKQNDAATG